MADHDTLDIPAFRLLFPAFSNDTLFPDSLLNAQYAAATMYISANDNFCGGLNGARLDFALQLLTAHLLASFDLIRNGETTSGLTTGATVDKVSVTMEAPPATNAWQFWLASTPYGMQLWAFLFGRAVGGWSVGGLPERRGFRKIGGTFR